MIGPRLVTVVHPRANEAFAVKRYTFPKSSVFDGVEGGVAYRPFLGTCIRRRNNIEDEENEK